LKKVLLIGNKLLGDSIQSMPAVMYLRKIYPDTAFSFLGFRYSADVYRSGLRFEKEFFFDEYPVYRGGYALLSLHLRRELYNAAVIFPGGFFAAAVSAAAGIPLRIGHNTDNRGFLLCSQCKKLILHRDQPNWKNFFNIALCFEKEMKRNSGYFGKSEEKEEKERERGKNELQKNTCELFNIDDLLLNSSNQIEKNAAEIIAANMQKEGFKKYAVYSVKASESYKEWPVNRYSQLAAHLRETKGFFPVFPGLPGDAELLKKAAESCGGLNLCGHFYFHDLIRIMRQSAFFAGNNSGLAHCAAMTGIPVLMLSGAANHILTQPWGKNVKVIYKSYTLSSGEIIPFWERALPKYRKTIKMSDITYDEVLCAAKNLTK